ncbi:MAG TPA: 4-hydroxy-tetrahydrodipicolinate synthase [Syntrophomonadaceae bacterium]|nr:4-hydroxy-tetrahydrodipicolinate synthase [Syntrophomonadaceae bacterium]
MPTMRLLTAMITPYYDNMEINYSKAAEISEMLADNGSDGIVVCGTTGESPVLSHDEKLKLYQTVKKQVGDRIQVWAGTGSNNTRATVELTSEAEKTGVDGIMLVTPYYNKPSQQGLYEHFKTAAESTSLPVMLYNIPGRTSTNLLPETVARLAEISNIVAIKEASGSMDQVTLLKTILPDTMAVYSGDDSLTLPMMAIGAAGVVSIASHLIGKEIKQMIEYFLAGDINKAREIHLRIFPIIKGLFITTNPVPLKEALNMLNMNVGGLRLPLTGASEAEKERIREMLKDNNILK